jgi:hypothetical protein
VFIFQFLNDKIHNYVLFDIIVNFVIQKLKNKHTLLKKPQKVATLLSTLSLDRIIPLIEPNFETSAVSIRTPCIAPSGSTYISFLSNRQCVLLLLLYVAGA